MERNYNLDFIKIYAMLGVIGLHSFSVYMNDSKLAEFLYRMFTISIPLFFMVNGWLMATKKNLNYKYALKKIFGILKFCLIITTLYFFVNCIITKYCDIFVLPKVYFQSFVQSGPFWHLWYLGAMIIIYLISPIINIIIEKKLCFLTRLCVCLILIALIISISNFIFQTETYVIQTFRIWIWLAYYLLGMVISKYMSKSNISLQKKIDKRFLFLIIILLYCIMVLFQIHTSAYIGNKACEYYYSSLPVFILSSVFFMTIMNVKVPSNYKNVISKISPLFLPVTFSYILMKVKFINRMMHI